MTADRSHCKGCFRTIDEIRAWSGADAASRRAVWRQVLARAGVTDADGADAPGAIDLDAARQALVAIAANRLAALPTTATPTSP